MESEFKVLLSNIMGGVHKLSGEVAQWLAPWTSSANREVGGSSLIVSTDDPLG